jgi:prepilin-type N-terminal cleavage/methylation domain-containing protein
MMKSRRSPGFTLAEMMVTIAVIALVTGVVVTAAGSTSKADLRKSSGVVAGAVRAAYDQAALSGKIYRLAFVIGDPKKNAPSKIRVEASPEVLVFDPETSTLTRALQGSSSEGLDWETFSSANAEGSGFSALDGPAADALDKVLGTSGKNGAHSGHGDDDEEDAKEDTGFEAAAATIAIDDDVRILSVWTEGMDKPADAGDVFLYFFPNGYTQDAIIHLQDDDRRVLSVRVAPLTGTATVSEGYLEAP